MSIDIGTLYITQIPALTDAADIQSALKLYHYGTTSVPTDPANIIANSVAGNLRRIDTTAVFTTGTQSIGGAKTFTSALAASSTLTVTSTFTANGNSVLGSDNTDTLTVNAVSTFAGNATFNGTLTTTGNTTIGNASTDTLTINATATGVTPTVGDNSTKIATTAFVSAAIDNSMSVVWFGDGSDGNVTISSPVTLTRDMYYNNLTIASGGAIRTQGYRVYVAGILDITSAPTGSFVHNTVTGVAQAGGNASGQTAGTAGSTADAGPINGANGAAGGSGQTSPIPGNAGGSQANTTAVFPHGIYSGAVGGAGTNGSSSAGAGGTQTSPTLTFGARRAWIDWTPLAAGKLLTSAGGAGGGSGGGTSGGVSGGGGGGGAGCYGLAIYANTINRGSGTGTSFINMIGGAGGNGAAGSSAGHGGGGGGGQGGFVYIVYGQLTGTSKTAAIKTTGGTGGNGGGTATGGAGGSSGAVMLVNLSAGTISYTAPATGTTPSSGNPTGGTAGTLSVAL